MSIPTPTDAVAIKLASLAVHAEELISPGGHEHDRAAVESILADPDVKGYMEQLGGLALLPVKRST